MPVLAILALALGLRLVAAAGVQQALPPGEICLIAGDAAGYWELGSRLADGRSYTIYDPPRAVLRMPGFPLLLALFQTILGDSSWAVRIGLACVGTAACGLVYWLGTELFDASVGLTAAALSAIWPTHILFSVLILSETLFATCMLASLIAIVRLFQAAFPPRDSALTKAAPRTVLVLAVTTGLLIGLATLVRPTWLVIGPAVSLAVLFAPTPWVSRLTTAGLILCGLAIALAPWTARNAMVTGRLVPTTLWVGPSLYDGLHPQADGSSHMEFIERDGLYRTMSEYDVDQYYRHKALEFARSQPYRTVQLAWVKLGRFWSPWPNADQFQHPAAAVGLTALFVFMMGFAAVGAWSVQRDVRRWLIPLIPAICFSAVHTVFVGSVRYRLPAEYPLLVLTAAGLMFVRRRRTFCNLDR